MSSELIDDNASGDACNSKSISHHVAKVVQGGTLSPRVLFSTSQSAEHIASVDVSLSNKELQAKARQSVSCTCARSISGANSCSYVLPLWTDTAVGSNLPPAAWA